MRKEKGRWFVFQSRSPSTLEGEGEFVSAGPQKGEEDIRGSWSTSGGGTGGEAFKENHFWGLVVFLFRNLNRGGKKRTERGES